jgi:hypothetical protein
MAVMGIPTPACPVVIISGEGASWSSPHTNCACCGLQCRCERWRVVPVLSLTGFGRIVCAPAPTVLAAPCRCGPFLQKTGIILVWHVRTCSILHVLSQMVQAHRGCPCTASLSYSHNHKHHLEASLCDSLASLLKHPAAACCCNPVGRDPGAVCCGHLSSVNAGVCYSRHQQVGAYRGCPPTLSCACCHSQGVPLSSASGGVSACLVTQGVPHT